MKKRINKVLIDKEYQIIDKEEFWAAWKHFGNKNEDFKIYSYWKDKDFFNGYYISWDLILRISLDKDSTYLKLSRDKLIADAAENPAKKKRGRPRKDKGQDGLKE